MAVAWPLVRAALASNLRAVLPGVTVYDGPVVSGDNPTRYLTVASQPSRSGTASGSFQQDVGDDGYAATETGTVLCELGGISGDATVPDLFTTFDLLATYVQDNPTLGGALQPASTVAASAEVIQEQTQAGAVQRLLISIGYFTRVP